MRWRRKGMGGHTGQQQQQQQVMKMKMEVGMKMKIITGAWNTTCRDHVLFAAQRRT